ncbi:MAG: adenosylcobalamin-dependent ribonucleoside-diphosphate reductase [Pseudomonadota bacterium]
MDELARTLWSVKYRQTGENAIQDSWRRVADALASVEPRDRAPWAARFFEILDGFRFLPGGRILAGAGTERHVTLFNCFVMGVIEDSMDGIFQALKEGALTMQQGGGAGYDFSSLRPAGSLTRSAAGIASGPVSFMRVWDSMCATVLSQGARRGAMIATLRCDHPDIEAFASAKQEAGALRHFNISVQIGEDFLHAVRMDAEWPLVFPAEALPDGPGETLLRNWTGRDDPVPCRVFKRIPARALWRLIMRNAYDSAEPGVLFIDRINRLNNLGGQESISATNPCGEIPLPPYGACDLGSLNLVRFVREPFTSGASIDHDSLGATAETAVRLLDNVIDLSRYPLPAQREQALGSRRIGLGITGLGSALVMLGLRYDNAHARREAAGIMRTVRDAAYRASVELAREKGPFPLFKRGAYLHRPFILDLPHDLRESIAAHGIRNSHLLAIAPAGSISLLADNVSSGLEPIYASRAVREVRLAPDATRRFEVEDAAVRLWREQGHGGVPPALMEAAAIAPLDHLHMQAALQPFVDQAISKTINVAPDYPFEDFVRLYEKADELGLKGCTVYRPNLLRGAVLTPLLNEDDLPHCEICATS